MKPAHYFFILTQLTTACDGWPGVGGDGGLTPGVSHMDDKSGNLGSSCGTDVKCNLPLLCLTTAPSGLCTKQCSSDADCQASGASCVSAFGGLICVKNCVSDQMCREGYSCGSTGSASVCLKETTILPDK
jgi:hypothetical protein